MLDELKMIKTQSNLAQENPSVFFQELKQRLMNYQTKTRMIEDDPMAILDRQIAKTIDDADNYLLESDSGVGTDSSEKFVILITKNSHRIYLLEISNHRSM